MSDKPGVLRNLRIKRVSLVEMGANFDSKTGDGSHIMLFKGIDVNKNPSVGDVHVDSPDWDADDQDEYEKSTLTAAQRRKLPDSAYAAVWTDAKGKKHRKLPIHDAGHLAAARGRVDGANIPASVKAEARRKIEAATKKEKHVKKSIVQRLLKAVGIQDAAARQAELDAINKAVENDGDEDDNLHKADDPMCKCAECMSKRTAKGMTPAEVEKAINDAVAKAIAPLQTVNANLQTTLNTEIEKRLDNEMRVQLSKFTKVGIKESDIPMFRKMASDNPELFKRQMEIFAGQQTLLEKSAAWGNIGYGGAPASDDSAWAQIEAKADAMLEKSSGNLTREQAIEKVMLDPKNKGLIKQYRQEQSGQVQ